jgi:hypothetical protein
LASDPQGFTLAASRALERGASYLIQPTANAARNIAVNPAVVADPRLIPAAAPDPHQSAGAANTGAARSRQAVSGRDILGAAACRGADHAALSRTAAAQLSGRCAGLDRWRCLHSDRRTARVVMPIRQWRQHHAGRVGRC